MSFYTTQYPTFDYLPINYNNQDKELYHYLSQEQLTHHDNHALEYSMQQNVYPTFVASQLPLYQTEALLQDDNFSIVTTSDFYYGNHSPLPVSTTAQLTPFSTPSPQITAITGDSYVYYNQYTSAELFAPVEQQEHPIVHTKSKKSCTPSTEKRHICPTCNHRSRRRHNLVEHMLTHNPHRPKSFLCGHCSRPFARKYDMKRHEKIHTR